MSKARLKSLYFNLGSEEKLRKIVGEFYHRMSKDILIGFFFACKDIDLIADRQHEFLLFAMGARTAFAGKDPKSAHRELPPILKGHFDRRLTLLKEVLEDYSLSDEDIRTWIDFEAAFRPVVETETHQKSS